MIEARRRTRRGGGASGRLVGEGDVERVAVDRPQLAGVSPISPTARSYSSVSEMSDTVVSSVDSVTGTPARWSAGRADARRCDGTMPAWKFEVGQRSRVTPRAISSRHELGVVDGAGAVGDPLGVHLERPADLRRAAPLAGMERDPQAAGPGGLERRRRGAPDPGTRSSGPARSQPVSPWSRKRTAASASSRFAAGRGSAGPWQISRTTVPVRAAASRAPRATAAMPSASDSPRATWSSGPQRIST